MALAENASERLNFDRIADRRAGTVTLLSDIQLAGSL